MARINIEYYYVGDTRSGTNSIQGLNVPGLDRDALFVRGANLDRIRQAIIDHHAGTDLPNISNQHNIDYSSRNVTVLVDLHDPAEGLADEHVDVVKIRARWRLNKRGEQYNNYEQFELRVPAPFGHYEDGDRDYFWNQRRNWLLKEAIRAQAAKVEPGGLAGVDFDSYSLEMVSRGTQGPVEVDNGGAPEGYITKEALQEVMRDLAIQNNWCPDHHRPMRELGVDPLSRKYRSTILVEIPVEMELNSGMGSEQGTPDIQAPDERGKKALIDALQSALQYSSIRTSARPNSGYWTWGAPKDVKVELAEVYAVPVS